jgi:hypothetical protein
MFYLDVKIMELLHFLNEIQCVDIYESSIKIFSLNLSICRSRVEGRTYLNHL